MVGPLLAYLTDVQIAADLVVVPATIGEFWMVGYLLIRGVRVPTPASAKVYAR